MRDFLIWLAMAAGVCGVVILAEKAAIGGFAPRCPAGAYAQLYFFKYHCVLEVAPR